MTAPVVAEAQTEPVSVVLSQSADQIATGKTSIIVTIRNDGDQAVTISKFYLPFDWHGPLPNRQFDVIDFQGQAQKYIGDWDKVLGRPASSFVHIGAHQTLTGTVELRQSYSFDTQVNRHFTVQYTLPLGIVEEGAEPDENSPTYPVDPNRARTVISNVLPLIIDPDSLLDPTAMSADPAIFRWSVPSVSRKSSTSRWTMCSVERLAQTKDPHEHHPAYCGGLARTRRR